MKRYRLMLSDNGGVSWYHHSSHATPEQAERAARLIPGREYSIIDCRNSHIVASGATRPHTRGRLDYETK